MLRRTSIAEVRRTTFPLMSQRLPAALALARQKESQLSAWLSSQPSVLLGFSGGVDSAYLGCVSVDTLGSSRVLGVIGRSASYPSEQWAVARQVASQFRLTVLEIDTYEMLDPRYVANPGNRCYFCKTELWTKLAALASERGISTIIDGTNADDLGDHRPGMKAAREHGIRSPLAETRLTKAEIRLLSRERGIPTWAQPSSPCLSSRIPHGTPVTPMRLGQVEGAERALRSMGIKGDLRVRHHGDLARIELAADELDLWLSPANLRELRSVIRSVGFTRMAVDLRGYRSGSLNILDGITAA